MPEGRLLTVRDIARELGLPESTVRYYRDAFAEYLPAVGTGRRRRYPLEAIPLLRVVAEGYAQNRARAEIEHALGELLRGDGATAAQVAGVPAPAVRAPRHDDLLATVLDGERERREVMWQMARELVRLGETIERQQVLLTQLAERIEAMGRALPAGGGAAEAGAAAGAVAGASPAAGAAFSASAAPGDELDALRRELAHERELVERLRRSKLDIERRAAVAEARLDENGGVQRRRGLLGKFLSQEPDSGR
jgi:DNA-binding transcriptional MerR regulator